MSRFKRVCLLSSLFLLSCANLTVAQTVYMNDGSELEAQAAWIKGEKVYVSMNADLSLDFPTADVDLSKSGIRSHSPQSIPVTEKRKTYAAPKSHDALDELLRVAGHRRAMDDLFGRNDHTRISEVYARAFTPALAEKAIRDALRRTLNPREIAEVTSWFKSRVGRKFVEADSIWDFNQRENELTYVGNKGVPDLKERLKVAGEIDRIYGSSEDATRITKQIITTIINAIPNDFPEANEIRKRMREEIPTRETQRDDAVAALSYSYRFLSLSEHRQYMNFLRSTPGKKYVSAVREATVVITQKVARNLEKELVEDIKTWAY